MEQNEYSKGALILFVLILMFVFFCIGYCVTHLLFEIISPSLCSDSILGILFGSREVI